MSLPTFGDETDTTTDVADAVRDHGRTLIPWLPDPPTCDCGALMYATETYDPQMVEYVRAWECRHCDRPDRYRDDPGIDAPKPPSEGAPALQEMFDS